MPDKTRKVLILGGTREARRLAELAVTMLPMWVEVITSYAGRTKRPSDPPGTIREGGFGGTQGLAAYLKDTGINLVVDATHPFAERISDHAFDACVNTETQRLQLARPPWRLQTNAKWTEVSDMAAAADAVGHFARRAFLTTGTQDIEAFSDATDTWFLVRLIEAPTEPLPLTEHEIILARPPFTLDDEKALLVEHQIDTVVSKHAGGPLPAKITAALDLGLPIILIQQPPPVPGNQVDSVEAALAWILSQL